MQPSSDSHTAELDPLIETLARVRALLELHGDRFAPPHLRALERRLNAGDAAAVVAVLSEVTGGMGSLNERWLSRENGDDVSDDEAQTVNAQLQALIGQIEREARNAASAFGVHPIR